MMDEEIVLKLMYGIKLTGGANTQLKLTQCTVGVHTGYDNGFGFGTLITTELHDWINETCRTYINNSPQVDR